MTVASDVDSTKSVSPSFYATLILALLRLAVEVTLNPTKLLRHSSQRKRASFKEASYQQSRTCHDTGITISGEEIIEDLYNSKMQLIPFAISPLGLFGPTINRFLYGKTIDSNNIHNINATTFPHTLKMANRASSNEVPSNILERANDIWRRQHPTENFGLSYKSPDPSTYYTQQFGRDVCFATGSAGLEAISLLGDGPLIKSSRNNTC